MLKNITLSGEERLIYSAREKAQAANTTLNALFRRWLASYVGQSAAKHDYQNLMTRLSYAEPGRKLSRDEMNER